ncbi:hypothetical protein BJX66DRAFT_173246 [Aspergillus keveii]|uniref:Uncharacterized protein n=1 Tax=Aspergillus keveii TaxID=714993 RepID=A0ABR4G896_9EURO
MAVSPCMRHVLRTHFLRIRKVRSMPGLRRSFLLGTRIGESGRSDRGPAGWLFPYHHVQRYGSNDPALPSGQSGRSDEQCGYHPRGAPPRFYGMIVSEMKRRVHGIQQRARRSASDLPSPRTSVQSTSDYELLSRIPDAAAGIARSRYCQCLRRNGVCAGDLRSVRPPTVELSGLVLWRNRDIEDHRDRGSGRAISKYF